MLPAVLLRFRDVNPGINTIDEHRKMIREKNAVWWGWWRKHFEPDTLKSLLTGNIAKSPIFIVDNSTARLFKCQCSKIVTTPLSQRELEKVPDYYRSQHLRVSAWFKFTEIRDCSKDYKNLTNIDQRTIYSLRRGKKPWTIAPLFETENLLFSSSSTSLEQIHAPTIIHVSDLHFGADHAFSRPSKAPGTGEAMHLSTAIAEDVKKLRKSRDLDSPPIICITGDLTTKGDWSNNTTQDATTGISALVSRLGAKATNLVLIPGNHDMERYQGDDPEFSDPSTFANPTVDYRHERSFRIFRRKATEEDSLQNLSMFRRFKTKIGFEVHVAALNSCRITATRFSEYGWIGQDEIDRVFEKFREFANKKAFRVLALHHHVVPVADVMRPETNGVTLTLDAGPLLKTAQRVGVRLVLHGHQHLSQMSKFSCAYLANGTWRGLDGEDVFVAGAGSAGSKSLPSGVLNSYTYVEFSRDHVEVRFRQLRSDGNEVGENGRHTLPIRPTSGRST